jgi:hypothetical protein
MDDERAKEVAKQLKAELDLTAGTTTPADPTYQENQLMTYLDELDDEMAKALLDFCEKRDLEFLIRSTTWRGVGVRFRTKYGSVPQGFSQGLPESGSLRR